MKCSLKCFIFLILIGLTRAHGRLIIMAILGLAGLWMVHLIAQDYDKITKPKSLASVFKNIIKKRSIRENLDDSVLELRWLEVFRNDPLDCVKNYVCQIAAYEKSLNKEEKVVLNFVRKISQKQADWNHIKESITMGELHKNPNYCQHMYQKCPYSSKTMMNLIKTFGG